MTHLDAGLLGGKPPTIYFHTILVYTILVLKNITFSADEALIRQARRQAALQNTTLNELFREWLEHYIRQNDVDERRLAVARYDEWMRRMSHIQPGRKFTREEMNERR